MIRHAKKDRYAKLRAVAGPATRIKIAELYLAGVAERVIARRVKRSEASVRRLIDSHWASGAGPVGTCDQCRGQVILPCLACHVRWSRRRPRLGKSTGASSLIT